MTVRGAFRWGTRSPRTPWRRSWDELRRYIRDATWIVRPHAAVSAAVEAHASRVPRTLDSTADSADPEPATIGDAIGLDDAEYERAEATTTIERLSSILDPR